MGVRIYISGNSGNQKVRQKDDNDRKSKWHELMFFVASTFLSMDLSWHTILEVDRASNVLPAQGAESVLTEFICSQGGNGSKQKWILSLHIFQIYKFAIYPHSMECINVCTYASFHLLLMWDTISQNLAKTVLVHKGIDTYSESLKYS